MDRLGQTSVEEQLKQEIDRLNQIVYLLQRENKGLKKQNGKQKHIIARMSERIKKLQPEREKQVYKNSRKGKVRR